MIHPLPALLPALLLTLCAPGQGDPVRAHGPSRPAASDSALAGTWIATGADRERLEFRPGGVLLVDGDRELRWRADRNRLWLDTPDGTLAATWRIEEPHLWLTLRDGEGAARTECYRREAPAASRATAGCVAFDLPEGWRFAQAEGQSAALDPDPDDADAFAIVTSGELPAAAGRLRAADLLRARLDAVAGGLADREIAIDARRAVVRAVRLPAADGAELTVQGVAGGERAVTVWVGVAMDEGRFALVLAVAASEGAARLLAGARAVQRSLGFVATAHGGREPAPVDGVAAGLAGLEFGRASFGSGSSLTVVYRFGEAGQMSLRRMFSSSIGGTDSTTQGSYTVRGDAVTMQIDGEVVEATVERAGGEIRALRIGGARYERS